MPQYDLKTASATVAGKTATVVVQEMEDPSLHSFHLIREGQAWKIVYRGGRPGMPDAGEPPAGRRKGDTNTMKVILMKKSRDLGAPEIRGCCAGLCAQLLVPRKLAVYANTGNVKELEHHQRRLDRKTSACRSAAQTTAARH